MLGEELSDRLRSGYALLTDLRLRNQLRQIEQREYVTDRLDPDELPDDEHEAPCGKRFAPSAARRT